MIKRFFHKLTTLLIRLPIRGYQLFISPLLGSRCRYFPTCSQYALEAVDRHGAVKGCFLALKRLSRCHPWGAGGYDPVPEPPDSLNAEDR